MKYGTELWRWLVNFWTVVLYGVILYDFRTDNGASDFIGPLVAVYVASLAIYTGSKEFERWREDHKGRHPGEAFVMLWTILMVFIFAADFFLEKPYKVPESIISTYAVVLGVLAITQRSKAAYGEKSKRKKPAR